MISFKTISIFRERLQDLIDYKRGVYAGAKTEVVTAFKNVPIEQIRQNRDMILMQDDAIAIKLSSVCPTTVSVCPRRMDTV